MKRAKQKNGRAPRNPLVAAVKFRKAGAHGRTEKALRRQQKVLTKKQALEAQEGI